MNHMKKTIGLLVVTLFLFSCTKKQNSSGQNSQASGSSDVTMIRIDGSSTVFLLTEAVVEEYQRGKNDVRVTVGMSGTGGGMKKFTANEIDIVNASRRISDSEIVKAKEGKVEFTEIEVAYDGIAIVVNAKNDFISTITTDELKKIWEPESKIKKWSDLNKKYPTEDIHLYGPGADSGTFDYFTHVINGKEKAVRSDFTSSENDNVLVQGISGDKYALGYFGYAYFQENKSVLKLLSVSSEGNAPLIPTPENIMDGSYKPLSRPLYVYVNNASLKQPKVLEFIQFYLNNAATLAPEVGYIPLEEKLYKDQLAKISQ
jgi:phosphate transport system substrate-binding protein